jgi:hypothetical protein
VAQQVYENNLKAVTQYWGGTATATQRQGWAKMAAGMMVSSRLGQTRQPSGYELFVRQNMNRLACGQVILSTAHILESIGPITTLTAVYSVPLARVTVNLFGWGALPAPYTVQYWRAGPFLSGGRQAQTPEYRYKTYKQPASAWLDTTVVANRWYWYRARGISQYGIDLNWFEVQVNTI